MEIQASTGSLGAGGQPPTLAMDKAGRVVLPKALRDRLRLLPGSELEAEVVGDHLLLRPVEPRALLVKEEGWWVYRGAAAGPLEDAVERHRRARLEDLSR